MTVCNEKPTMKVGQYPLFLIVVVMVVHLQEIKYNLTHYNSLIRSDYMIPERGVAV